MSMFEKDLNMDAERIRTPAEYDEQSKKWVISTRDTGTLYGLSTDTKPTTNIEKGTAFFEIDTTDAYMYDGSQWRLI